MSRHAHCRRCGKACHWLVRRSSWVHDQPGADHAPIPDQAL